MVVKRIGSGKSIRTRRCRALMWRIVLAASIVLGIVQGLHAQPVEGPPNSTDIIIPHYSAIAFPPSLGGIKRISCYECECKSGMSCSYSLPHVVDANIYIATSGLIDVPDGAGSEAVKKYLTLSSLPVMNRESSENGHSVKVLSEGKKPIKRTREPRSFLYKCFQLRETTELKMNSFPGDDGIRKSYISCHKVKPQPH